MNISLQQQYAYLNWRRRVHLQHLKMLKECHDAALIQQVRNYILAGINPATNPDIEPVYTYLIGEYGEGIFQLEQSDATLSKEEDPDAIE